MTQQTVGILSPGDMGHSVGQVLNGHGLRVVACLDGRSDRTRALSQSAGIEELPNIDALVNEAGMILSILVPAQAKSAAEQVAATLKYTQTELLYVDCNAIAPETTKAIGTIITEAGGRFVDASIIGPPPRKEGVTRFYASGKDVAEFAKLGEKGLDRR